MALSLNESVKEVQNQMDLRTSIYNLEEKIVKICPVDPCIMWLQEIIKKEEINASKICIKHTTSSAGPLSTVD